MTTELNTRKHYQCLHAFADGWEIEVHSEGEWKKIAFPTFDPILKYRVIPDKDGWFPWYGGKRPVDSAALIKYTTAERDYIEHGPCEAGSLYWGRGGPRQVILYRIVRVVEPDPYAELEAASVDPNKQIRICGGDWEPGCNLGTNEKFVKAVPRGPAKKTKKVKLVAWLGADNVLRHVVYGSKRIGSSKLFVLRVPSEDKEVEIEVDE